jgi:hypothetical protein|eukprot:COSAG01_NODE_2283_length_7997_cov_7.069005_4_plen_143_part_00
MTPPAHPSPLTCVPPGRQPNRAPPEQLSDGRASPPTSPVSSPEILSSRKADDAGASAESQEELASRTLIILDWDDTMMNTSRLTERYMVFGPGALKPLPASLRSDLAALETDAIQMLDMFRSRGCAPLFFLFWPIAPCPQRR